jgi:hypothetical protein
MYFDDFLDFSFGVFSSPVPVSKIPGDASFEGENEFLFLGRNVIKGTKIIIRKLRITFTDFYYFFLFKMTKY